MNGNPQPLEVAMGFIKSINAGDIGSLCELMTENHIFQDALGKRFMGRETMRQGWTNYLKMVTDYQVHADEFFQTDETHRDFRNGERPLRGSAGPKPEDGKRGANGWCFARRRVGAWTEWVLGSAGGVARCRAGWEDCRMARLRGQSTAAQADGRHDAVTSRELHHAR